MPRPEPRPAPERSSRGLLIAIAVLTAAIALVVAAFYVFRPMIVPDVVGRTDEQASALIARSGFAEGLTGRIATARAGDGLVISQRPAAGTDAPARSAVDVTVAVSPESTSVPDVAGQKGADAAATLADMLFVPYAVGVFDKGAAGTVLDQAPAAGASWTTGRPVAVAVSLGPNDGTGVKVPSVMGKHIEPAFSALEKAGLKSYDFVLDISDPGDNVVVAQLPKGGVIVRPGTVVLVIFEAP